MLMHAFASFVCKARRQNYALLISFVFTFRFISFSGIQIYPDLNEIVGGSLSTIKPNTIRSLCIPASNLVCVSVLHPNIRLPARLQGGLRSTPQQPMGSHGVPRHNRLLGRCIPASMPNLEMQSAVFLPYTRHPSKHAWMQNVFAKQMPDTKRLTHFSPASNRAP